MICSTSLQTIYNITHRTTAAQETQLSFTPQDCDKFNLHLCLLALVESQCLLEVGSAAKMLTASVVDYFYNLLFYLNTNKTSLVNVFVKHYCMY